MNKPAELWTAVGQGLGFALRSIRRAPGFTALLICTLALGLGANTTMFGIVDRLLLSPPEHIRNPDRVMQIFFDRVSPFTHRADMSPGASYPDFQDLMGLSGFDSVAGYANIRMTAGAGRRAEKIRVQLAAGSYFDLLGVHPRIGRFYAPEDDRIEGGSRLAVLSSGYWKRRYGADEKLLGKAIRIGSADYTVVGIAPQGFTGATIDPVDVWLPLLTAQAAQSGTRWRDSRRWYWFRTVARLSPGTSAQAAQAQATAAHLAGRAEEIDRERYDPQAKVVLGSLVPGRGLDAGGEASVSRWLAGVALLVLLIACANVANLLLARAVRWRRELAVRKALGISAVRLGSMLLVESLVLAVLSASAAIAVAVWSNDLIYSTLLPQLEAGDALSGPRLLLFTGAGTLLAALLAGLIPAVYAARADAFSGLRGGRGASTASGRLRAGLLLVQVGLSVVLLVGAGLFVRSLRQAHDVDLGFDPQGVLVASVESDQGAFNDETSAAVVEAMQRLRGAPGVESAAVASLTPFRGHWGMSFFLAGKQTVDLPDGPYYYAVSADYFRTMGMRLLRGRGFQPSDMGAAAAPVAVFTQDLARRTFGQRDPLGQCIFVGKPGSDQPPPCTTVVGILADHRTFQLQEGESVVYYLPVGHPSAQGPQTLVVKAAGEEVDVTPQVRRTLLDSIPDARYAAISPATDIVATETRSWRLGATLFTAFGLLALVVASLGLYALIAFDVAQKRRELGIRAALGASGRSLILGVFRRALALTASGCVLGLGGVLLLARFIQPLLFQVDATDPTVLALVVVALAAVSAAAAAKPARRASRVSPAEVLRAE